MTSVDEVLASLQQYARPEAAAAMARFGIRGEHILGVSLPNLRALARKLKKNHPLALELWKTNIREARILASLVADPALVTPELMEAWARDFDSWELCDQTCGNLFDRTPYAYQKARAWSQREEEFVRRAGFVMMAELAVHDKKADDEAFAAFFPLIVSYASDERNFVKKAVNWALRQIGKRNSHLRTLALACAQDILQQDSKAARWVARDAIRELQARA
ncbi:DNA alkylation repair protein [Ktedonosporobacter rubrisoli]|uniref:DNA alkylation repair protein n=1 Tax=Ktedonosporobacter rubrisoli TaxID=2509675 RepID=A0A4P6JLY7_KTERU|nr:DNA alkylation repair protein [Ktedonosporobacter rubrisoli]QBD76234.1 DNA alkylation repair protein [Ktedonosporobacter rubrisoli]